MPYRREFWLACREINIVLQACYETVLTNYCVEKVTDGNLTIEGFHMTSLFHDSLQRQSPKIYYYVGIHSTFQHMHYRSNMRMAATDNMSIHLCIGHYENPLSILSMVLLTRQVKRYLQLLIPLPIILLKFNVIHINSVLVLNLFSPTA